MVLSSQELREDHVFMLSAIKIDNRIFERYLNATLKDNAVFMAQVTIDHGIEISRYHLSDRLSKDRAFRTLLDNSNVRVFDEENGFALKRDLVVNDLMPSQALVVKEGVWRTKADCNINNINQALIDFSQKYRLSASMDNLLKQAGESSLGIDKGWKPRPCASYAFLFSNLDVFSYNEVELRVKKHLELSVYYKNHLMGKVSVQPLL